MIFLCIGWGKPGPFWLTQGKETDDMAVSQGTTDFCAKMEERVQAAISAATASIAAERDALQAKLDALSAGVQQDEADNIDALNQALDQVAPQRPG